jgi:dihydroflavonol-4-reductase
MKAGRRVLVTGAAGFIGGHLVNRLAAEGMRVRAVDLNPLPQWVDGGSVEAHRVDIRDVAAMAALLEDVDVVFHLASVHLEVHASESDFTEVNVEAVGAVVRASARAGVRRIVHTSSVGIFGHVEDPPAGEDAPTNPITPYERTKLAGERRALEASERSGVEVVVVRPAWVYGPGCPRTRKLLGALGKRRFFFVGDGSNLRHPVYIDEAVEGFVLAARAGSSAAGRTFIIAGPRAMPLREMVDTAARVLGVPAPRIRVPVPLFHVMARGAEVGFGLMGRTPPFSRRTMSFFANDNAFSTDAAEKALGYRPRVDFEEGLRRTLDAEAAGMPAGTGA